MLPILLGDKMSDIQYCYITEQYYIDNAILFSIIQNCMNTDTARC